MTTAHREHQMKRITHWIDGKPWNGTAERRGDVYDPSTGQVSGQVDFAGVAEVDQAVAAAAHAFTEWRHASLARRAGVLFAFRELVHGHRDELAALISAEHGKVRSDALGEVSRGLEVVEFACGIPQLLKGGFSENVSTRVDSFSIRQPLGVVAGITPFNFPAMVPMWMFPLAIACGNSFVLKPSEKDPSASIRLAELWAEAGLDLAADAAVSAGFGSAGERCMAISVVVAVGGAGDPLLGKLRERVAKLRVGPGSDPSSEMGPLVTGPHRDRVASYLESGVQEGATLAIDGRRHPIEGDPEGFWLGPSVLDHVGPQMRAYADEIFGPVLSVVRVPTYQAAIELVNANPYGNGTAIFTNDGGAARRFQNEVEVGMIGINVPIPVPMAYYSFCCWKSSLFGDTHVHGTEGVHFYTRGKVVTARWLDPSHGGVNLGFPTNT